MLLDIGQGNISVFEAVPSVQRADPNRVRGRVWGESLDLNRREAAAAFQEHRCCFSKSSLLLLEQALLFRGCHLCSYPLVNFPGRKITIVVAIVHTRLPMQIETSMTNMPKETNRPYPNNLRTIREKRALISRAQLILRCEKLFQEDETQYVKTGMTTLHDLEVGRRRPRPSTAATLAAALDVPAEELFPLGFDLHVRNPGGNTTDPNSWQRTGRPKKRNP